MVREVAGLGSIASRDCTSQWLWDSQLRMPRRVKSPHNVRVLWNIWEHFMTLRYLNGKSSSQIDNFLTNAGPRNQKTLENTGQTNAKAQAKLTVNHLTLTHRLPNHQTLTDCLSQCFLLQMLITDAERVYHPTFDF